MEKRQKKILNSIIKEHQRTGQPVSSQSLMERFVFDFSPATMRAEMLELDETGFLEQPHTSAGRVPTDKAWRFFVEEFCDDDCLNAGEKQQIDKAMEKIAQEGGFMAGAMAEFLSDLTRHLGISGVFGRVNDFHEAGFKWLARENDFENGDLRQMMKSMDSLRSDIENIFEAIDEEVKIFIGQENPVKYLKNCSLVVTNFETSGHRGLFGILGPKRMNYQKNKSILKEARKKIS